VLSNLSLSALAVVYVLGFANATRARDGRVGDIFSAPALVRESKPDNPRPDEINRRTS